MLLKNIKYLFLFITYITLFAWTYVVYWASNKGLDLSDEGYAIYYLSEIGNININISLFHLVQDYLLGFVNITIQNLRLERLVLNIFTTTILSFSFIYFLKNNLKASINIAEKLFLFAFIYASLALTYAFGGSIPSYNIFSYTLLSLCLSVFIVDISKQHSYKVYSILYITIGVLVSFLFLVKISNALLFVLLIIAYLLFEGTFVYNNFKKAVLNTLLKTIILIIGFTVIQLLVWGGINNFFDFFTQYKEVLNLVPNHNISNLITNYTESINFVINVIITTPYLLLVLFTFLCLFNFKKERYRLSFFFLCCVFYIVVKNGLFHGGANKLLDQTILFIIITSIVLLIFAFFKQKNSFESGIINIKNHFVYFLFIFPLVGVLGTSNYLHIQLIFYFSSWFLIVFLFIILKPHNYLSSLMMSSIIIFSMYLSYDAIVNNPYRLNTSLKYQNKQFVINKNDIIYIDKDAKRDLEFIRLKLIENGFNSGDYIFTYSELNALAYILNSPTPSSNLSWFFSGDEKTNIKILNSFFKDNNPKKLYFIMDERTPYSDEFIKYLALQGYDIKNNYNQINHISVHLLNETYPITIYSPKI